MLPTMYHSNTSVLADTLNICSNDIILSTRSTQRYFAWETSNFDKALCSEYKTLFGNTALQIMYGNVTISNPKRMLLVCFTIKPVLQAECVNHQGVMAYARGTQR